MKPVRSSCHRPPGRRHGFSEASEHGIGTLLGGVLEEERVAHMPHIELAALDEAHAVEVSVANTHHAECLAPTLRTKDPARLSALDLRQVVISDELDDEAFEWTPSVDLAILLMRLDVVAGCDAVSIKSDQHIPSLLHEGIPVVIRPERTGVPSSGFLLGGAVDLYRRFRRLARNDATWTLKVNTEASDPFGPAFHSVVVTHKGDVPAATDALAAAIHRGEISHRAD